MEKEARQLQLELRIHEEYQSGICLKLGIGYESLRIRDPEGSYLLFNFYLHLTIKASDDIKDGGNLCYFLICKT